MPVTIILVIIILLLAGFVAALAFGLIRFEKPKESPADEPPSESEETEPEPLVNLKDYYAEVTEKKNESGPPPDNPPAETEEEQYDMLCNVKVGRGYFRDCQNILFSMRENRQPCAVIYFDYNRFRFLNTLKGYSTGDYALTRIAQEAKIILPEQALLTRLGADHFAAIFAYIDEAQLQDLFEQLKRAADRIRGDIGAKSGLQICMGVALTDDSGSYDIFTLIRKANIARHCLKSTKPDTYTVFNDTMITSLLYGESTLENYNELQYDDDFALWLRPQLLLSSKRIAGCDSRFRWSYEGDGGEQKPDGDITSTGNIKTAYHLFRTMSRWRKSGAAVIPAMVTLGELDILKEDIDAFFARCFSEFQLDAGLITVAISLHTLRMAPETVRAQLNRLRDMGIKLAICDIDNGVEGLDILKEAPVVNCFKLHRNFVQDIESQPQRQEQARKIISMASELNAITLFEGANNASTITWLAQAGAGMAQGRYVGRENPPDEFVDEVKHVLHTGVGVNTTIILDDNELKRGNFRLY